MRCLSLLLLLLVSQMHAQTGTIKVRKVTKDPLTFALFEKSLEAKMDSVRVWFGKCGFKEGQSKMSSSLPYEGGLPSGFQFHYFISDSLELRITTNKRGKVTDLLLFTKNKNTATGKILMGQSMAAGYTVCAFDTNPDPETYQCTGKNHCRALFNAQKKVWTFELVKSDRLQYKK
ncbi:MAG TPA: hypothetical protein VI112_15235 [Bacteroidia bacterium]